MDAQSAWRVVHVIYPAVGGSDPGAIVKHCAATAYLVGRLFHLFRGHHLGQRTAASKAPHAGTHLWRHHCGRGYCSAIYSVAVAQLVAAVLARDRGGYL